ncbi:hypothetical protein ACWDOR_18905 [Streptosporangium canum]|uniref:hypothetical protein n=1 Tax=Streptosporangium canum TaxID=324952 RepID=UPI0036C0A685
MRPAWKRAADLHIRCFLRRYYRDPAKNPGSDTARDGFDRRAQFAADNHQHDQDDEQDDD